MTLERLVHTVEERLTDLGRHLLRPGEHERLREELDAATAERDRHRAALRAAREERDSARKRLQVNEATLTALPAQIESSVSRGKSAQAVRQAIELERCRQELAEDRAALPRLEQVCWSKQFHVRLLERRIERLLNLLHGG